MPVTRTVFALTPNHFSDLDTLIAGLKGGSTDADALLGQTVALAQQGTQLGIAGNYGAGQAGRPYISVFAPAPVTSAAGLGTTTGLYVDSESGWAMEACVHRGGGFIMIEQDDTTSAFRLSVVKYGDCCRAPIVASLASSADATVLPVRPADENDTHLLMHALNIAHTGCTLNG